MKHIIPVLLLSTFLYSCGNTQKEETLPAYHNPTVQPFTDSIHGNPDNANLYFLRAEALSKINNDSLALIDVLKAQSLDKKNPQYSFTIGYLNLQLGHADAAVKALEENLKASPGNVNTRILLAKAFLAAHKIEAAKSQINQLLAAAPQHTGAMIMQAAILTAEKDTMGAIDALNKVTALDPRNYQAVYSIATLYGETNNDKAIAQYQQAFWLDTMDVTPLYDLAAFYETRKDIEKAKQFYTTCILKDRDFTDAYIALGKIFLQEKNTEKALRHFNLAIETHPNDAEAYSLKGQCFEVLHQKDSAVAAYNQALVFNSDLKEAKEGLKRMK
jgi:tetratricopeptide (TPR) repeat protein